MENRTSLGVPKFNERSENLQSFRETAMVKTVIDRNRAHQRRLTCGVATEHVCAFRHEEAHQRYAGQGCRPVQGGVGAVVDGHVQV